MRGRGSSPAGRISCASPGDYLTFLLAGESVLVVNAGAAGLRAIYNVCRHRGRELVEPWTCGRMWSTPTSAPRRPRPDVAVAGRTPADYVMEMPRVTPEVLAARILAYLRSGLGIEDDLTTDTPLVTSGIVDSAALMRLAAFIERETGITIPDPDINVGHFDTVRKIVEYMATRGAG